MNDRVKKTAAVFLSFTLLALSLGLEPYAAAASRFAPNTRAGGVSPIVAVPFSAAIPPVQTFIEVTPAPIRDVAIVQDAYRQAGTLTAAPLTASAVAPINPFPSSHARAAADSARRQLSRGADQILSAAAPSASAASGAAALDTVFAGRAPKVDAGVSIPTGPARERWARFAAASRRSKYDGPPQPATPHQSLGRSLRVGFLSASAHLAIHLQTVAAAQALGYHFHPDYEDPFLNDTLSTLAMSAIVMAPIAEEIIFRGGLMGGIHAITRRIPLIGQYWIPATLSSLLFVAAHEMSDPVLFASRFVGSMIMSYAFQMEGITSSMFSHAFINGFFVLALVFAALLSPLGAGLAALSIIPVSLYLTRAAYKITAAETPQKQSGQLIAFKLNATQALILAIILIVGSVFISPNPIWIFGALGWTLYALRQAHALLPATALLVHLSFLFFSANPFWTIATLGCFLSTLLRRQRKMANLVSATAAQRRIEQRLGP